MPFKIYTDSQRRTITPMPNPQVSYQVIDSNPQRRGLFLYNQSGNTTYVTFGTESNGGTCTFSIGAYSSWSMLGEIIWTGPIAAIRNAGTNANFQMVVTELLY